MASDWKGGYDWLCSLLTASRSPIGFLGKSSTLYRVHQGGAWSRLSRREQRHMIRESLQAFLQFDNGAIREFVEDAMRSVP